MTEPNKKEQANSPAKLQRDLRQELTDKLVQSLEQRKIPWNKPWTELNVGLPRNMQTGREYRGGNRLMLMLEQAERGFTDPRYGTLQQINALGGRVKKGEHGIPVELWKEQPFYERKDVSVTLNGMRVRVFGEKDGIVQVGMPTDRAATLRVKTSDLRVEQESRQGRVELSWAKARELDNWTAQVHTVFNVAQCEGLKIEPLAPAPNFDPVARGESIKAAMEKDGLKFAEHPKHAFYSSKRDEVSLPPRGAFNSAPDVDDGAARYYGTLLHEIGHATGAAHRLNREGITGGHRFGSEGYAKEELRAEMFSMFMAAQTGIPHDAQRHIAYVQDWAKVLKNDKNEIFRAAAEAGKAVDYVLAKEQSLQVTRERQASARAAELAAKTAADLKAGDRIVENIPGHAVFADMVNDVRFLKDGKVHVDINGYTGTRIYDEKERVRVVPGRQERDERTQSPAASLSDQEKDAAWSRLMDREEARFEGADRVPGPYEQAIANFVQAGDNEKSSEYHVAKQAEEAQRAVNKDKPRAAEPEADKATEQSAGDKPERAARPRLRQTNRKAATMER